MLNPYHVFDPRNDYEQTILPKTLIGHANEITAKIDSIACTALVGLDTGSQITTVS